MQLSGDLFINISLRPFCYSLLRFFQSTMCKFCRLLNKSYVIEKNFVAAQPIEMTWTMNDGNEENDSVDTKSLEAVVTLNSENKCLVHSSKIAIPSETLTQPGTKLDGESTFYCHVCGLHRFVHEFV